MNCKKNSVSINSIVIVLLVLIATFKLAEFQCLEPDCEQNTRNQQQDREKNDKPDIVLPFLDLQSPIDVKMPKDLSEVPIDSIINWKISPEFKSLSAINPKSSAFLPVVGRIAKKAKQNWIQEYRESKRTTGGNRNFQTQGWK